MVHMPAVHGPHFVCEVEGGAVQSKECCLLLAGEESGCQCKELEGHPQSKL